MLRIQLFGHFHAQMDGSEIPEINLNNARRLLALMALQAGKPVGDDWVAEQLWPDTASLLSLRKASQQLRRVLGTEAWRLTSRNGELKFNLNGVSLDAEDFYNSLEDSAPENLGTPVDLYTGPLLADYEESWVVPHRESAVARYVGHVDKILEAALARNQTQTAILLLRKALSHHPERETWWTKLIECQAMSGSRLEAAASVRRYHTHLQNTNRKLGLAIPPSPIIVEMHRKLQLHSQPIAADLVPDLTIYEAVGGAAPAGSPFYVERPADLEVRRAVQKHTSLVLIKGSGQTGKSSLLSRILRRASEDGITIIRTSWLTLREQDLTDIASFYRSQIADIGIQAALDIDSELLIRPERAATTHFNEFIRDHLLQSVSTPVLWAIDDVDRLFSSTFRDDVFAQFRAWHNERALDSADVLNRFTIVMTYSAEAHLAISNLNQSPFNVGTRVTLTDFTPSQALQLNVRYNNALTEMELLELYTLVGGHPYLMRKALLEVGRTSAKIGDLLAKSDVGDGIFTDHLNRMFEAIHTDPEISSELCNLLVKGAISYGAGMRLCAAGVLSVDSHAALRPRNALYDRYLRRRLL